MFVKIDFTVFKYNLQNLMASRNLLAIEVAKAIGISKTTMSRYISGDRTPDLAYVVKIAQFFGVTVEWLLGLDNTERRTVSEQEAEFLDLYSLASDPDKLVIKTVLNKYKEET